MAFNPREAELKEIYLGYLQETEEISPSASPQEGNKVADTEEKRREERLYVFSEVERHYLMLGQMKVDKGRES